MTKADRIAAEKAEAEAIAQLAVIRALKPLDHARRCNVMQAVVFLVRADELVPGVIDSFLEGRRK